MIIKLLLVACLFFSCENAVELGKYDTGEIKYEVPLKDGKRHGRLIKYYRSGEVMLISNWIDDVKQDSVISYFKCGNIQAVEFFKDGKPNGTFKYFDSTGVLLQKVNYLDGLKHGINKVCYSDGSTYFVEKYHRGKLNGKGFSMYPNRKTRSRFIYDRDSIIYYVEFDTTGLYIKKSIFNPIINVHECFERSCKVTFSIPVTYYDPGKIGVLVGTFNDENKLIKKHFLKYSKTSDITLEVDCDMVEDQSIRGFVVEYLIREDSEKREIVNHKKFKIDLPKLICLENSPTGPGK